MHTACVSVTDEIQAKDVKKEEWDKDKVRVAGESKDVYKDSSSA